MKKLPLSAAIAATLTLPMTGVAEQSSLNWYGKINLAMQSADEGGKEISELNSNSSRLGVKGEQDLDQGLKGFFKAEFEVQADDGDKDGQTFSQRNIYAGVKGEFGSVQLGNFDTPLKKAQGKVDLFSDLDGDVKSVITKSDNRASNIGQYSSPKFSGLQLHLAHIASEDTTVNDGTSSALQYKNAGLYAAIAYDTDVEADGIDVTRFAAQYKLDALTFGTMHERQAENGDTLSGRMFSVSYKVGKAVVKAQYGASDIISEDAETYSLGVDYKLGKTAKVYAYSTNESFADDSDLEDNNYQGAGLELKF